VAAAAIDRLPTDNEGFSRRGIIEIEAAGLDGFGAIQENVDFNEESIWKSILC
jgi:hypothetical protein